jgi:protein-S-isoprenylcysteine O-methyltransferase Ste14
MKVVVRAFAFVAACAGVLFGAAGTAKWLAGWVYVGLLTGAMAVTGTILVQKYPAVLEERSEIRKGSKRWDFLLSGIMAVLGPFAMLAVAGLNVRCRWQTEILPLFQIGGTAMMVAGYGFVSWAMFANTFFSPVIRIQKDRGHTVVSRGPYSIVRHPGYLGAIIYFLSVPLILGSGWAFVPSALTIAVTLLRTVLEDRTLLKELDGYAEYAGRVRYRLLPGIW